MVTNKELRKHYGLADLVAREAEKSRMKKQRDLNVKPLVDREQEEAANRIGALPSARAEEILFES